MSQGHPFYNPQNPNTQQQIFTPFQNNPNVPTYNSAPPTNGPPPTGFQNTYPQNTNTFQPTGYNSLPPTNNQSYYQPQTPTGPPPPVNFNNGPPPQVNFNQSSPTGFAPTSPTVSHFTPGQQQPFTAGPPPTMYNAPGSQTSPVQTFPAPVTGNSAAPPPQVNYSPLSSVSTHYSTPGGGAFAPTPAPAANTAAPKPGEPLRSPRDQQKINPNQIPSPTSQDPNAFTTFNTRSNLPPPPVTVPCSVVDDGNASPKFMRMTLYNIPTTSEILKNSHIPFGFLLTPLADQLSTEENVPLVDFGPNGPLRCIRCKSYINPFVTFTNGGRSYICKLCDVSNDVPADYFSPLLPTGKRQDYQSRPELSKGVVDFVATKEYCERPPVPATYLFALDVSYTSVTSGVLQLTINSIKKILGDLPEDSTNKIGILTYDTTVHFYNLNPALQNPQMLVVPDVENVFLPLSEEVIFVRYREAKNVVDTLLDKIPIMFANSKINDSAFGSALQAGHLALKNTGGRILAFQTVLPSTGIGKLTKRDDMKSIGTDKEKTLYTATEGFYTSNVKEFVKSRVSVDMFICPSVGFVDVATLGHLTQQTGGELYYYPNFNMYKDAEKLHMDLYRNLTRQSGYDGLLRVRTGRGVTVVNHYGNFYTSNNSELELSSFHSESSIFVELKHEEKLDERSETVVQTALLYTTNKGERRIRVFNMSLPVTSVMGNIFRNADLDTIVNFFAKQTISEVTRTAMSTLRANLLDNTVNILYSYRKFCATSSSPGQLILPEALKLLPVFVLSILKNPFMRPGTDVYLDERSYYQHLLNHLPLHLAVPFLYPRMYSLHTLAEDIGITDERGIVKMPNMIRLSNEMLSTDGIYLLEDGQRIYLWFGKSSNAHSLINGDNQLLTPNYENPEEFSTKVHVIMNTIRRYHVNYQPVQVVRQGEAAELRFSTLLVEDKGLDTMTYVDFLCHVHRQIQSKLM